jgi:GNAT superfamily N-acetyltransferase
MRTTNAEGISVREAHVGDTPEVLRLAGVMYEAMGRDPSQSEWREAATEQLRRRLGQDVMVMVAEDPISPDRLVATAAASIATRLPGPGKASGRVAYVQWIATDPAWRRRGLAREVTTALLEWLTTRDVPIVELHATAEAAPMYRALGFEPGPYPAMRLGLMPSQTGSPEMR